MNSPSLGPASSSAAIIYLVLGAAGLALVSLRPWQLGQQQAALAPLLIGIGGLLFLWRWAPLAMLAALAALLVLLPRRSSSLLMDLLLALGLTIYLLAQYRLYGLRSAMFAGEADSKPRADLDVRRREIAAGLLSATGAVVLAVFLWELTALIRPQWRFTPTDWRLQLIVWAVAAALMVLVGGLGYWSWRRQSRDEALLRLRDKFWRQTRGEQRKINRWLAWARRQRERAGMPWDE
jgi:hypothetical protein